MADLCQIRPEDAGSLVAVVARARQVDPAEPVEIVAAEPAKPICSVCDGVGFYKKAVRYWDPDFGKLFPCICRASERERLALDRLFERSNLGAFHDKTFATFSPDIPGVAAAMQCAREYAANPRGTLVLLGRCGIGKTHLAAAIGHEVFHRKTPQVIMAVVPDLLDHLRSTFGPSSEKSYDEIFAAYCEVEVLILDDFGTQNTTAWAREKLYQIINHRYNYALATVITTNHEPHEIDPRIWSRLCDGDRNPRGPVLIQADDYRLRLLRGQALSPSPARKRGGA